MFKQILLSVAIGVSASSSFAAYTVQQGMQILLSDTPSQYNHSEKQYVETYQIAEPLFQSSIKLSEKKGQAAYQQLESLAQFGDIYSNYHLGHIQLQYSGIFGSTLEDAIKNLKVAEHGDVVHAQYALALAYRHKSEAVSKITKTPPVKLAGYESMQLFLKGAQRGFGPSFLQACRDFELGTWFKRNLVNAEQCYTLALEYYGERKAMPFLANLYLNHEEFKSIENEAKALDYLILSTQKYRDEYSTALLGHYYASNNQNLEQIKKGKALLEQAIDLGSKDAELFYKKIFK